MKHKFLKKLAFSIAFLLCTGLLMVSCGKQVEEVIEEENEDVVEGIVVDSCEDFLEAIEPGATILLKKGTYDFTEEIIELYDGDGKSFNKKHDYVQLEEVFDGIQIVIQDVDDLTISSLDGKHVELQVEPRYADVISFRDCSDITITDLTIGHTIEQGSCVGDVLEFWDCENITLENLDLYGCGTYGINAITVSSLDVNDCVIRDCSYGIVSISDSDDINFKSCELTGSSGYTMLEIFGSEVTFNKCTFDNNDCSNGFLPFSDDNTIAFKNCYFGTEESIATEGGLVGSSLGITFDSKCTFENASYSNNGITYVYSMEELADAIKPAATIYVMPGTYNMTDFTESVDIREWNRTHPYVKIEEVYDGHEIHVNGVYDLVISGYDQGDITTYLVTEPRYADLFSFKHCYNIELDNMSLGHTDEGHCEGDVISLENCSDVFLGNMDLFGCGVYGLRTYESGEIYMYDSVIHDCEYGPFIFNKPTGNTYLFDCQLYGSSSGGYIEPSRYRVYFDRCSFGDEESTTFKFNPYVSLLDCSLGEILSYPENYFGSIDDVTLEESNLTEVRDMVFSEDLFWRAIEIKDGTDSVLLPEYDMSNDEYNHCELAVLEDGTGFIVGLSGEDIMYFTWEASSDESYLIISETENAGFEVFDEDVYLYLYKDEGSWPPYAALKFEDVEIWFLSSL